MKEQLTFTGEDTAMATLLFTATAQPPHCQSVTSDQCASEFPTTLQTISRNLQTIYSAIRSVYSGRLVALTYYSTNYDEPAATALSQALNHVIAARTVAAGGAVADGYAAFGAIASHFQGNPCTAGLLIKEPDGTCDVHPTAPGRTVLALAVDVAVLHPRRQPAVRVADGQPGWGVSWTGRLGLMGDPRTGRRRELALVAKRELAEVGDRGLNHAPRQRRVGVELTV